MVRPEKDIEKEIDNVAAVMEALVSAFQFQVNKLKQGETNTNRVRTEALKGLRAKIKSAFINDTLTRLEKSSTLEEQEQLISQAFELIAIALPQESLIGRWTYTHQKWIPIKFEFLELSDKTRVVYDYLLTTLEYVAELIKKGENAQKLQDVLDDLFSFSAHAHAQSELILQIKQGIEDIRAYMVIPKKSERMLKIRTKFVELLKKIPSDGAKKKITV